MHHDLIGASVYSNMQTKTYKQALWLRKFGHRIPKRTLLYSSSPIVRVFDAGKLQKSERGGESGVRTYRDKRGRKRCVGSAVLKKTQQLGHTSPRMIFNVRGLPRTIQQLCGHLRKYPVKFAREIVNRLPLFRSSLALADVEPVKHEVRPEHVQGCNSFQENSKMAFPFEGVSCDFGRCSRPKASWRSLLHMSGRGVLAALYEHAGMKHESHEKCLHQILGGRRRTLKMQWCICARVH